MKLLFKQRFFSWFDSYDIYDDYGTVAFTVEGRLAWGHKLEISNSYGEHIATIKEEVLTFLPRFALYIQNQYIGEIKKDFSFFNPTYSLNCNDWQVQGDMFGWNYNVRDSIGNIVMQASKQLFNWTDTYVIEIANPQNALLSLMVVLAIDAANCSQK